MSTSRSLPSSPRRDPAAEAAELQSIFDLSTVDFASLPASAAVSPRAADERMRKRTGSSSSSPQGAVVGGGGATGSARSTMGVAKELRKLVGTRSLTETKPMAANDEEEGISGHHALSSSGTTSLSARMSGNHFRSLSHSTDYVKAMIASAADAALQLEKAGGEGTLVTEEGIVVLQQEAEGGGGEGGREVSSEDSVEVCSSAAAAHLRTRTVSLDEGVDQLFSLFYERKLKQTKESANKDIDQFLSEFQEAILEVNKTTISKRDERPPSSFTPATTTTTTTTTATTNNLEEEDPLKNLNSVGGECNSRNGSRIESRSGNGEEEGTEEITITEALEEVKKCAKKVLSIRALSLSLDFCQSIVLSLLKLKQRCARSFPPTSFSPFSSSSGSTFSVSATASPSPLENSAPSGEGQSGSGPVAIPRSTDGSQTSNCNASSASGSIPPFNATNSLSRSPLRSMVLSNRRTMIANNTCPQTIADVIQEYITRLLLIISKVSRIVAFLELDGDEVTQFFTSMTREFTKAYAPAPTPSSGLLQQQQPSSPFQQDQSEKPYLRPQSEDRPQQPQQSQPIGAGSLRGQSPKWAQALPTEGLEVVEKADANRMLICRICEKAVPVHALQKHTDKCARRAAIDTKVRHINDALTKAMNLFAQEIRETATKTSSTTTTNTTTTSVPSSQEATSDLASSLAHQARMILPRDEYRLLQRTLREAAFAPFPSPLSPVSHSSASTTTASPPRTGGFLEAGLMKQITGLFASEDRSHLARGFALFISPPSPFLTTQAGSSSTSSTRNGGDGTDPEVVLKLVRAVICNVVRLAVQKRSSYDDCFSQLQEFESLKRKYSQYFEGSKILGRVEAAIQEKLAILKEVLSQRLQQPERVSLRDFIAFHRNQGDGVGSGGATTTKDIEGVGIPSLISSSLQVSPSSTNNIQADIIRSLNLSDGISSTGSTSSTSSGSSPSSPSTTTLGQKVSIKDFTIIKPISRGAFGHVFLAKKNTTGDIFAIKALKKEEMLAKNQIEHIQTERHILSIAQNPFVVNMYYCFQSKNYLYMVLEYLPGGDLFSLLQALECFSEPMAKRYTAEIVLALEYIHNYGIVHRDLKPDNILIAKSGHVKLTDFGLSRVGFQDRQEERREWELFDTFGHHFHSSPVEPSKNGSSLTPPSALTPPGTDEKPTMDVVGTPDYIAPEIFLGTGHGAGVDWWALGCMVYEFLVGFTPFYGESCEDIFENILNYRVEWPPTTEEDPEGGVSPQALDFIKGLLTIDPEKRLGAKGATEVKSHPWFADINWDTLLHQEALFVPKFEDINDTSYFDPRQDLYPTESNSFVEKDSPTVRDQRFRSFTFINVGHLENVNKSLSKDNLLLH